MQRENESMNRIYLSENYYCFRKCKRNEDYIEHYLSSWVYYSKKDKYDNYLNFGLDEKIMLFYIYLEEK